MKNQQFMALLRLLKRYPNMPVKGLELIIQGRQLCVSYPKELTQYLTLYQHDYYEYVGGEYHAE